MLKEFEVLIERFSSNLSTGRYNNYVKVLQNSLIPYLEHYCTKEGITVEELFKKMISASHIIDAGRVDSPEGSAYKRYCAYVMESFP